MDKRELSKLQDIKATEEYFSLANRFENIKYFVKAATEIVKGNKILVLYLFLNKNLKQNNDRASFRIFMSKDDYITQDITVNKIKWRTSSLGNLIDSWHIQDKCACVDDETLNKIKQFINSTGNVFTDLLEFQQEIMKKRLDKKHQVIKDAIDNQMSLVPKLPDDFEQWLNEIALYKSRYIVYEYKKGKKQMDGYCTYCKSDIVVKRPRHNQEGICPNCGSPITYKAKGRSPGTRDDINAAIIQKTDDVIIIRHFSVNRSFTDYFRKQISTSCEETRDFYYDNKIKSYEWNYFKQTDQMRWCDYLKKYIDKAVLYTNNLDETLKNTKWEYSAIKQFAEHKPGFAFDAINYFNIYGKYPFIEYLVKLRLYNLTCEITNSTYAGAGRIEYEGNNLQQILKINKSNLPLLQKMDASLDELRLVQVMESERLNLPVEQIKYINNNLGCATPLLETARYTTINKAIKYLKSCAEQLKNEPKEECCHHGWYVQPKSDIYIAYQDWMDYINFCIELNYDLKNEFVIFPKDLKEAHDKAAELAELKKKKEAAIKQKLQREKIKSMANELNKKYSMEFKDLKIIAPADADTLTNEGHVLHHCVGTYVDRIADGRSIVLFVRKTDHPEKPYCTLEIQGDKVYQVRGRNNIDMREALKTLLNKFEKTKLNPLITEEAV